MVYKSDMFNIADMVSIDVFIVQQMTQNGKCTNQPCTNNPCSNDICQNDKCTDIECNNKDC